MGSASAIHRRQQSTHSLSTFCVDGFAAIVASALNIVLFYFRFLLLFFEYIKFYRESFRINKQFKLEFPFQILICILQHNGN